MYVDVCVAVVDCCGGRETCVRMSKMLRALLSWVVRWKKTLNETIMLVALVWSKRMGWLVYATI